MKANMRKTAVRSSTGEYLCSTGFTVLTSDQTYVKTLDFAHPNDRQGQCPDFDGKIAKRRKKGFRHSV